MFYQSILNTQCKVILNHFQKHLSSAKTFSGGKKDFPKCVKDSLNSAKGFPKCSKDSLNPVKDSPNSAKGFPKCSKDSLNSVKDSLNPAKGFPKCSKDSLSPTKDFLISVKERFILVKNFLKRNQIFLNFSQRFFTLWFMKSFIL